MERKTTEFVFRSQVSLFLIGFLTLYIDKNKECRSVGFMVINQS
jgi:hypothetical protein